jgi:magnesium transporter
MTRLVQKRSRKTGLPPGTAVHIGEKKSERTRIQLLHYDATQVVERELEGIEDDAGLRPGTGGVTWVHVTGVHDVALLDKLGRSFGLHPLVVEDIANTDQRPKLEDYGDYAYVVLKTMQDGSAGQETRIEQLSLILGADFVLSFEESEPTAFEAVRARIRDNRVGIRAHGADYLAYSLLDSVVDNYFLAIEGFGNRVEALQQDLIGRSSRRTEGTLHELRREMMLLRKSVWPLREVIGTLERGGSRLFRQETWVYLRDVYDHVIHMVDTLETFHEMLTYMLDLYLLNATNRLNEIIKVLTIIATIFSPPMLIASIYGMNFRFMPELGWPWGYGLALGLMTVSAAGILLFFRRRKWI